MIIDEPRLRGYLKNPFGAYTAALYVLSLFKKQPREVAAELNQLLSGEELLDVIGYLSIGYECAAPKRMARFVEDDNKEGLARKQLLLELFGDKLRETMERRIV